MIDAFIEERGVTVLPPGAANGLSSHKPTAHSMVKGQSEWLFNKTPKKCNEEDLAKAKILTMLKDLGGNIQGESFTKNVEQNRSRIRHEAHRWFFSPKSDLQDWCDTAGFDLEYVRGKAREVYENGLPKWRADPGGGTRYGEKRAYRERAGR